MDYIVVFITAPDEDTASNIARKLVEEKLAACVNIIKDVRSIYRWEGKVQDDKEVFMIVKSRAGLFNALSERVKSLHSYSVPEVIALPITSGLPDYLAWIGDSTA